MGSRNTAILRLLFDLALRRGEVAQLDLADLDIDNGTIQVIGKGRDPKTTLTLPAATCGALRAWLMVRGAQPGPLFRNFDRARKGNRLTDGGIYRMVRNLGRKIGLVVRPHGLRHAAITKALDLTGGNVRSVQKFSRHRNMQTLMVYDDNRQNLAGTVSNLIAEAVCRSIKMSTETIIIRLIFSRGSEL